MNISTKIPHFSTLLHIFFVLNPWHKIFDLFDISSPKNQIAMLRWSVTFLVIAIIAAIFGFGGIAAGAAGFAKILFYIAIAIFLVTLLMGRNRINVD